MTVTVNMTLEFEADSAADAESLVVAVVEELRGTLSTTMIHHCRDFTVSWDDLKYKRDDGRICLLFAGD